MDDNKLFSEQDIPTAIEIKKIFDHFFEADLNVWSVFRKYIQCRRFKRNEVIKDYSTKEKYINIIASGAVGHFVFNGEKDICINLYFENQLFSDYLSFLTQSPTEIKTCALENCLLWSIKYHDLQDLYVQSRTGLYIGKAIGEAIFIRKQREQINLLTLSPAARYMLLLRERPEVIQRIPLKIICSYIGITAESLSRIRKKNV